MSRRIRRQTHASIVSASLGALPREVVIKRAVALTLTFGAGLALTSLTAMAQPQNKPPSKDAAPLKLSVERASSAQVVAAAKPDPASTPAVKDEDEGAKAAPVAKKGLDLSKLGIDLSKIKLEKDRYVQYLSDGRKVTLTLDPTAQQRVEKLMASNKVTYGSVVLIEPETGRVLAMVDRHDGSEAAYKELSMQAVAPSASVFKVVTIAALLEEKKATADEQVCYHGGRSSLSKTNIEGSAKLDKSCGTLSDAMAWSINSIIAKLAYHRLSKGQLDKWASKFGYNTQIPFELELNKSEAKLPEDKHDMARGAAGFWHTYLSPLHGALIGATIINDGVMMVPTIVERVEDSKGKELHQFKAQVWRRVVSVKTARQLKAMMDRTTSVGTARKYFRFRNEFPSKKYLTGGKTGTLSRKTPSYLGYTWFVGYGEAKEHPGLKVGVSSLICNTPIWHIKGPYAASEAVRVYLDGESKRLKDDT